MSTQPALTVDIESALGGLDLRIAFQAAPGVTTLFGPSGSGKTTTLNAIAGLFHARSGEISVGPTTWFRRDRPGPRANLPPHRRHVGYLFQDLALFPHLSALDNVAYPLHGHPDKYVAASALLERFGVGELARRYPTEMSGGQQQRVALARVLAHQPDVLLLDEPFSALDAERRRELRRELRAVRDREQIPIILVTHDVEDALALSDTVIVLDHGRVVAQGPPIEILERPSAERLSRLIEVENIFQGRVLQVMPDSGLTCAIGGTVLELPYAKLAPGDPVRVGIRAGDIMLATEQPRGLSARNLLPGRVLAVEPKGFGFEARVDCGPLFRVQVTRHAVETLQLAPGQPLWLVIKSNSCFLIE